MAAGRYAALLCAASVCLLAAVECKRLPWWSIRIAQQQGPHACVVEEVPGTYMEIWTECRYWTQKKICQQNTLIRYECCEGYQQLGENHRCTAVKPLTDILQTAEDIGAKRFVAAVRQSGMARELAREGAAYTLFAPSDYAFKRMSADLRRRVEAGGVDNAVLLYHLLDGKLTSKDMKADQLVTTRSPGARLRLSKYSSQITTANCRRLMRKNQKATNGIVHVIDGVLDPLGVAETPLVDLVSQDGRFTILSEALRRSGYERDLRKTRRTVTLLAPSDEAFQKLTSQQRNTLLNDTEAAKALFRHHVVPHPICKSAITGEHKMKTKAGSKIEFDCDKDKVLVDGSQARAEEILTEDGVLLLLDDVIIPDRARSVQELAERQHQLSIFLALLRTADLPPALTQPGPVTWFAPSDSAFSDMPEKALEAARSDQDSARRLVLLHGARGRHLSRDITDSQVVTTLDESTLRLQVHRSALGVEDALLEVTDVEAHDGVLHVINRVLRPVTESAGDILRQRGGFSMFLQAMERVMRSEQSELSLHGHGTSTFFVPNDNAFSSLGDAQRQMVMNDMELLTQMVKNHISERMLPAASFQPRLTYRVTTKEGTVNVRRHPKRLTVNDARVLESDILNTNGIIHVIDKVLLPFSVEEGSFKSSRRASRRGKRLQGASGGYTSHITSSRSERRRHRQHHRQRSSASSRTYTYRASSASKTHSRRLVTSR